MPTFDVDKFLKTNAVEIKLGDKTFTVSDIPYDMRDKLENAENEDIRALLVALLGCSHEDLAKYGYAAYSAILREVTKNLFQAEVSQELPSND